MPMQYQTSNDSEKQGEIAVQKAALLLLEWVNVQMHLNDVSCGESNAAKGEVKQIPNVNQEIES